MKTNREAVAARDVACLVIGPIGDKDAEPGTPDRNTYEEAIQVLEEVIEPACRGYGIEAIRADQISRTGEIPEQVFRLLKDSYLVVADLTGANPNVMYELGLRHTTGKLTIQIGERERLPFDVAVIRTIRFRRSEAGLVDARRKLSTAIAAGLEKGGDPVSATRVWFGGQGDLLRRSKDGDDDDNELGYLEKLTEMSEGIDAAVMSLTAIPEVMNQINVIVSEATGHLTAVNASGGPASARVAIADRLASHLTEPASRLEVLAGDYRHSIERMNDGISYALSSIRNTEAQSDELLSFREHVSQMIGAAEETFPAIQAFRDSAKETGEATRALRRTNRRIATSLEQILQTSRVFEGWKALL
jgi:methyl-accepting chemotaxis protein